MDLRLLSSDDIREIHTSTMEILERVGVKIHETNALRMIDEVGAEVNPREKIARIPEHLVREALKRAPGSFTLYRKRPIL